MDMREYHLGFLNQAVQLSVEKNIDVEAALELILEEESGSSETTKEQPLFNSINQLENESSTAISNQGKRKHLTQLKAVFSAILLFNVF